MRPITNRQIHSLQTAVQHFHDCYLVSSLNALSRSENGRKILRNNIRTDGKAFTVRFNNINGHPETYLVKQEECEELIKRSPAKDKNHNPIVNVVELAMSKLLNVHPEKKPFVSRLGMGREKFEYNKPSNFLYMFTGKKPLVVNEDGIVMNLKGYKKFIDSVFKRISLEKNASFVAGTGIRFGKKLHDTHCFALNHSLEKDGIKLVQQPKKNKFKFMQLFEGRKQKNIVLSFKEFINSVKYVTGYYNEMLA